MPRDQQSSIDRLPQEYREQLNTMLRDPRLTQLETKAQINAILEADGRPDKLSYSAINRYKQRVDKVGARLKQSREMASMWIGKLGAEPQGQVGHLVNEILRTLSFDMTLLLQEGTLDEDNAPAVVDMLKGLSLTMMRLEKAASENVKRDEKIRKRALEEAARTVGSEAKQRGLSDEAAELIKAKILGIATR